MKIILKLTWNSREAKIAETVLKKKNKVRRVSLPDFRIYYIEIKTLWYQQRGNM